LLGSFIAAGVIFSYIMSRQVTSSPSPKQAQVFQTSKLEGDRLNLMSVSDFKERGFDTPCYLPCFTNNKRCLIGFDMEGSSVFELCNEASCIADASGKKEVLKGTIAVDASVTYQVYMRYIYVCMNVLLCVIFCEFLCIY
jgi:hypothetical protein